MTKKLNSVSSKILDKPKTVNDKFEMTQADMRKVKNRLEDLFINSSGCWTVPQVRFAIDALDNGNFNQAGRLCDAMTKDGRIASCLNTLVFGILSLPFEWRWEIPDGDSGAVSDMDEAEPYQPTDQDKEYLQYFKDGFWTQFVESSILSGLMKNIINMGLAVMSKSWESEYIDGFTNKVWMPYIKVMHPSNVYYLPFADQYYVNTYSHGTLPINPDDERFQIVKHVDEQRPWMNAAVRSIGFLWIDKWTALADWRSFISVSGNPLRVLTTNLEFSTPPEDVDIEQFIVNLGIARQYGMPVQIPQGWTLDLLEATQGSTNIFKDKVEDANKEIAIAYLGQNLSSDIGESGSRAAAEVHHKVLADYIEAYTTTLNRALREIVKEFYLYNVPAEVKVPVPFFNSQAPTDELQLAKVNSEKGKALQEVATALEKLSAVSIDGKPVLNADEVKGLLGKFM